MNLHKLRGHRKLLTWILRHSTYSCERRRARILLALLADLTQEHAAFACACARSTIVRFLLRFRELGLWSILDMRRFNGTHHPEFDAIRERIPALISTSPHELGWGRSRWSYELLAHQLQREFSRGYHRGHIPRVLEQCNVRRVVPRQSIALQPYDHYEQAFRLFEGFVDLPEDDLVLFCDEVDIHLNPKMGPVLAVKGERPCVETPGKNEKRYLAGSYDVLTGHLIWVRGFHKRSELFIELCQEIAKHYCDRATVHLIVDNYKIHKSKKTRLALEALGGKLKLHFLPPYSPEYNDIEPVWGVLHNSITRCHRFNEIEPLCDSIDLFLTHVRDYGLKAASLAPRLDALSRESV